MQMIRVLVVDDMQPICRRYEKLINQEEDMEVVGLAFSGAEALEMVRNLEPNVVLMDIEMETKTSGLDASRDILQMYPEMKIIILTVYEEDEFVFQAFQTISSKIREKRRLFPASRTLTPETRQSGLLLQRRSEENFSG